jgi:hypothetical protein
MSTTTDSKPTIERLEHLAGFSIGDKVKVNCNPSFYFYINLNDEMKKWKDKPMTIKYIYFFQYDILKLYTIQTEENRYHWSFEDVDKIQEPSFYHINLEKDLLLT